MMLLEKQKNIVWLAKQVKGDTVLEIGFNAGFSTLLLLLSNPHLKVVALDLGEHDYAQKCFHTLQKDFPDRLTVMFGDSRKTLPSLTTTFSCIHIDGGHSEEVAKSDVQQSRRLLKPNGFLLIDDTNLGDVQKAIQTVPLLKEVSLPFKTTIYTHSLYTIN